MRPSCFCLFHSCLPGRRTSRSRANRDREEFPTEESSCSILNQVVVDTSAYVCHAEAVGTELLDVTDDASCSVLTFEEKLTAPQHWQLDLDPLPSEVPLSTESMLADLPEPTAPIEVSDLELQALSIALEAPPIDDDIWGDLDLSAIATAPSTAAVEHDHPPNPVSDSDDDKIIGLCIVFDPTSEMLRETLPADPTKTKLRSLQQIEPVDVRLLGRHLVDSSEISTEDLLDYSNSDLFDSAADWIPKFETWNGQLFEGDDVAVVSAGPENDDEEIEIVFYYPDDDDDYDDYDDDDDNESETDIPKESNYDDKPEPSVSEHGSLDEESYYSIVEGGAKEEIEILFLDESDDVSETESTQFEDCLSIFTPSVSFEEYTANLSRMLDDKEEKISQASPAYEWFLPDHIGLKPRKRHTPHDLLRKSLSDAKSLSDTKSGSTPTVTLATESIASNSFENYHEEESVVSDGSRASDAVQDLVEFCRAIELPVDPIREGYTIPMISVGT